MHDHSYSSLHPPLPPTTEDDRVNWLRLLRSRRVGIVTFWRLLEEHGSATNALDALPEVARAAGVKGYEPCPEAVALSEFRQAEACQAQLICFGEPDYPQQLANIPDAPPAFWMIGERAALSKLGVALVGARNASSLGIRMARSLAEGIGRAGYQTVSGLARGIDRVVHLETMKSGTTAIMAGGVDVFYPTENTGLAQEIIANGGALISEQPMGMRPMARHFPMRNRIISGMAQVVVVIEAAAKSGSLITARYALDQGRDVLAVPGHPMDARASGCNILIRDGARLVRNASDVLEMMTAAQLQLPFEADADPVVTVLPDQAPDTPRPDRSLKEVALLHSQILNRLSPSPVAEDQLIRDLGVATGRVSPVLTELELDGRIERKSGGMLALAPEAANARSQD